MKLDFFFWWSVVSTVLGVFFLITSIWQFLEGRKQKERNTAQVKIWMQNANGIAQALMRIVQDNLDKRYTSTNDVCNTVWSVHSTIFALYQSFYEERCVTEEEYKKQQKEIMDELKKRQTKTNTEIQKNGNAKKE